MSIKYRTCGGIWNGKGSRFVIRLKPFIILINIFMPAARLFANSLHKKWRKPSMQKQIKQMCVMYKFRSMCKKAKDSCCEQAV
jgi:hypothetical protein